MPAARSYPAPFALAAFVSFTSITAHAQTASPNIADRPLEQGIADISPLGTSFRIIEPGSRIPADFESVYTVPGAGDMLMRISGAITAVFRRSEYTADEFGLFPLVPSDTIFYIGDPPATVEEQLAARRAAARAVDGSPNRISNRITSADSDRASADIDRITVEPLRSAIPTVWSNEAYRRARLAILIRRAAG